MQFLMEKYTQEIKRLKQENKELREKHKVACDYIEWCGRTITKLLEAEKELQEQLEKERELYYGDDDDDYDDWGRE
jgi:cell division septum initiation protein DivIVA